MRRSPQAIRQLLTQQARSGLSVARFCADEQIKVATFYAWKRKYRSAETAPAAGFDQLLPAVEPPPRSLLLPSGLEVSLLGLSPTELAELILAIDAARA